jgi:DNA-binding transcriptional regulator/RsmH inhibitor MraZ
MEPKLAEPNRKEAAEPLPATFQGTAYHKVSARHQVALPRHMLKVINLAQEGQLLMLRLPHEGWLRMYTRKHLDKLIEDIQARSDLDDDEKADLTAGLSDRAVPIDPDSQGRFVLPSNWVEELGLHEEIAFRGTHKRIEIWPAAARRDAERQESERLVSLARKVKRNLDL